MGRSSSLPPAPVVPGVARVGPVPVVRALVLVPAQPARLVRPAAREALVRPAAQQALLVLLAAQQALLVLLAAQQARLVRPAARVVAAGPRAAMTERRGVWARRPRRRRTSFSRRPGRISRAATSGAPWQVQRR